LNIKTFFIMEKQNSHFSIRLIYNLSRILFWVFAVLSSIIILFALILNLFSYPTENYTVSVEIPTSFMVHGKGMLNVSETNTAITISEASGSIAFENPPRILSIVIFLALIPLVLLILYSLWIFKSFTYNVKIGEVFEISNIKHLKKIAYVLFGIWLYLKVAIILFNSFLVPKIDFDGLEFSFTSGSLFKLLALSLFVWVLSHIFQKGVEIAEENKLTV